MKSNNLVTLTIADKEVMKYHFSFDKRVQNFLETNIKLAC